MCENRNAQYCLSSTFFVAFLLKRILLLYTLCFLLSCGLVSVTHNLHCVNDYLYTINCSLSIAAAENTSDNSSNYWINTFLCFLTNTNGEFMCSVNRDDGSEDTFVDMDIFELSLCHSQKNFSETCELLEEEYSPEMNIKPNVPCCFAVSHNSSQRRFTWRNTYEEYSHVTALPTSLMYQLQYYKRGDRQNVRFKRLKCLSTTFSMDDETLEADTEYAARVRSSPNQVLYMGEWSDWSPEAHWRTESVKNVSVSYPLLKHPLISGLVKVFIPLCVAVTFLLLCYTSVKNALIPTPAPYFHTLYSDCHGDFKSWVVTKETGDILKAEETLPIDTLTKYADIQEELKPQFDHLLKEGNPYVNVTRPDFDSSLLGVPSGSESPAEEDSGCYLCSHPSLERGAPFYCNEYCTLSAFRQGCWIVILEQHAQFEQPSFPRSLRKHTTIRSAL
uniref:Fibronectin type-III domain-containing protein n=1 Tax=Mola mola TaxID=94237 RepID=A0A3Q3VVE4_MOLML